MLGWGHGEMPRQSWISTLVSMDATQSFGLSFKPIVHGDEARMQDQCGSD